MHASTTKAMQSVFNATKKRNLQGFGDVDATTEAKAGVKCLKPNQRCNVQISLLCSVSFGINTHCLAQSNQSHQRHPKPC